MKPFTHFLKSVLLTLLMLSQSQGDILDDFVKVNPDSTNYIFGNYAIAGNTVMCLTNKTSGYGGTCQDSGAQLLTSNNRVSKYIDIDGDASTWNSTSSYIMLPSTFEHTGKDDKGVLWAGLFWQGRISTDTNYKLKYANENGSTYTQIETGKSSGWSLPSESSFGSTTKADHIRLKVDSGSYTRLDSDTFYTYKSSGGITYAAYSDVTDIVKPAITSTGKHTFTVANLVTDQGREPSPGVFGGWSLVVIYAENNNAKMRNITVFSGFDIVSNPSDPFTITDFLLPKSGDVHASLSLFSGEGEYRYGYRSGQTSKYDWVKMSDDGTNYNYMPDAAHDKNIFDAVLTGITRDDVAGSSNNLQINNNGVDIDNFDVSTLMTSYRDSDPLLNKMYIKWSSNNDYITPSMLVFATELYIPKFCFDYGYKQNGNVFTEENDGTQMPNISGYISSSGDIDVTLYIKNLEDSDILARNVELNITNIDTTQATYIADSTSIMYPGEISLTPKSDSAWGIHSTDSYIKKIPLSNHSTTDTNKIGGKEYVYTSYKLDPQLSGDINISIDAKFTYMLEVPDGHDGTISIPYTSILGGTNLPMCTGANFDYQPETGVFNVVDRTLYHSSGSTAKKHNLFTQVANRPFDVDVVSFTDGTHLTEMNTTTVVAVEMIDAGLLHDVNASCHNPSSAITDRVWVKFEDTNTTSVPFDDAHVLTTIPSDFYSHVNQNTAFRVSWQTLNDDGDIIQLTPITQASKPTKYNVENFPSLTKLRCLGGTNSGDPVPHWCSNSGHSYASAMTEAQLEVCMECIYGISTWNVCSRDNFSIRPEALNIVIQDEDINNAANNIVIPDEANLSAGYEYRFDVNATNHVDNNNTPGYTRHFIAGTDSNISFVWSPLASKTTTGCNDKEDKSFYLYLNDGVVTAQKDKNTNVGRYQLQMRDKSWTDVDQNADHHSDGTYFLSSGIKDCIEDNDTVPLYQSNPANYTVNQVGCTTSSNHTNLNTQERYNDYNLTFRPDHFTVNLDYAKGTQYTAQTSPSNFFIYMNNVQTDPTMGLRFKGSIAAQADDNSSLSNFVKQCYSEPLSFDFNQTITTISGAIPTWIYNYKEDNASSDVNGTLNASTSVNANILNFAANDFNQYSSGLINITLLLNFDRNITTPQNPINAYIQNAQVSCQVPLNCSSISHLKQEHLPDENLTLDSNVTFVYGRNHTPRYRITGDVGTVTTYYEAYCNTADGCSPSAYPLFTNGGALPQLSKDDIYWYINAQHSTFTDGEVRATAQSNGLLLVKDNNLSNYDNSASGQTKIKYTYDESKGYPYKTTIDVSHNPWLIYHKFDKNATSSSFNLEFNSGKAGWAGKRETDSNVDSNAATNSNRRIMW